MLLKKYGRALTVKEVCELLAVSKSWVYANAHQLGGVKLGGSLRFFEKKIEEVLGNALQESSKRQGPVGSGHKNSRKKNHQGIQNKGRSDRIRGKDQKTNKGQDVDRYDLFA